MVKQFEYYSQKSQAMRFKGEMLVSMIGILISNRTTHSDHLSNPHFFLLHSLNVPSNTIVIIKVDINKLLKEADTFSAAQQRSPSLLSQEFCIEFLIFPDEVLTIGTTYSKPRSFHSTLTDKHSPLSTLASNNIRDFCAALKTIRFARRIHLRR